MPFRLFWASIDKSESSKETTKAPETLRFQGFYIKAENRTRTDDPFITSEVLYQLSYFSTAHYSNVFIVKNQPLFY